MTPNELVLKFRGDLTFRPFYNWKPTRRLIGIALYVIGVAGITITQKFPRALLHGEHYKHARLVHTSRTNIYITNQSVTLFYLRFPRLESDVILFFSVIVNPLNVSTLILYRSNAVVHKASCFRYFTVTVSALLLI